MKRCPECRRDYYDETLLYCLDDGSALLEGPGSTDGPNTAIMSGSLSSPDAESAPASPTGADKPSPEKTAALSFKNPSRTSRFDRRMLWVPLVVAFGIAGIFA